jgi:hypothetical protein
VRDVLDQETVDDIAGFQPRLDHQRPRKSRSASEAGNPAARIFSAARSTS